MQTFQSLSKRRRNTRSCSSSVTTLENVGSSAWSTGQPAFLTNPLQNEKRGNVDRADQLPDGSIKGEVKKKISPAAGIFLASQPM
jgi:hypothetical protein